MSFSQNVIENMEQIVTVKRSDENMEKCFELLDLILSTEFEKDVDCRIIKSDIVAFFEKGRINLKYWDLAERNEDILKIASLILYIVNREKWNELKAIEKQGDLKEVYAALDIYVEDTSYDITEKDFYNWAERENTQEAYEYIYRMYCSIRRIQTVPSFKPSNFLIMITCLFETYFALLCRYEKEIREACLVKDKIFSFENYVSTILLGKTISGTKEITREEFNTQYISFNCVSLTGKASCRTSDLHMILKDGKDFIMLIGDAGSGKTSTLLYLQYLMLKNLSLGDRVPVYIRLNTIYSDGISQDRFFRLIADEIATDEKTLRSLLQNSQIQLFFDNLDEVSNITRKEVIEHIRKLRVDYDVPIIITDRNYEQNIFSEAEVDAYYINALNRAEIINYFKEKTKKEKGLSEYIFDLIEMETLSWIYEENCNVTAYKLQVIIELAEQTSVSGEPFPNRAGLMPRYLKSFFRREVRNHNGDDTIINKYRKVLRNFAKVKGLKKKYDTLQAAYIDICGDNDEFDEFYSWALRVPIIHITNDSVVEFVDYAYEAYFLDKVRDDGKEINWNEEIPDGKKRMDG